MLPEAEHTYMTVLPSVVANASNSAFVYPHYEITAYITGYTPTSLHTATSQLFSEAPLNFGDRQRKGHPQFVTLRDEMVGPPRTIRQNRRIQIVVTAIYTVMMVGTA
jgi:hypothetical protein